MKIKIKETYRRPAVKWCPVTTSLGFAQSGQTEYIDEEEEETDFGW